MSARSRRSRKVSVGMLSRSVRHSLPSRTGVLPVFTTCFGPRTAAAGFSGTIWPVIKPVEQHPHGGELLLHVRCRMRLLAGFNVAGHVDGADRHQCEAALIAPGEKLLARTRIGSSRVRVADVGGEEFQIAPRGLVAGVGDQRWHQVGVVRGGEHAGSDDCGELIGHSIFPRSSSFVTTAEI
jgi:hypothetical protein